MSKLKKQQDSYILKNKEKLLNKKRKIKFIKRYFFIYSVDKRSNYFMFKIKLF